MSSNIIDDNDNKGAKEADERSEVIPKEVFDNIEEKWNAADSSASSLPSDSNKTGFKRDVEQIELDKRDQQRDQQAKSRVVSIDSRRQTNALENWLPMANLPLLPFHHLIPATRIAAGFSQLAGSASFQPSIPNSQRARLQVFWRSLAAQDFSAKEAALFDNSLECRLAELDSAGNPIEINWQVKRFDELEGCAEIYLAEMLIFKRQIYEAGDNLRDFVELAEQDLFPNLDQDIFAKLTEKTVAELFLENLFAPFTFSFNISNLDSRINEPARREDEYQKSYRSRGSRRIDGWMGSSEEIITSDEIGGNSDKSDPTALTSSDAHLAQSVRNSKEKPSNPQEPLPLPMSLSTYRIKLMDYWADWQRVARLSVFDFVLLNTLSDPRTVRFYELTKLSRVIYKQKSETMFPAKLEIDYEKFISLMPLPPVNSEMEIRKQIDQIIKPLRTSGYVKSFSVKADWRGIGSQRVRLIFRFNDYRWDEAADHQSLISDV